jgi:Uma2 family endonuclease
MLEFVLDPDLLAPERIIPRRRLLSRRAYDQLVERGVLDDERLELLRGRLVTMSPQGVAHSFVTGALAQRLSRTLDESYRVLVHSPFAATDDSEPEPDISVSRRGRRARYHPSKALLLVEVAKSSLREDRIVKAEIYARNRAPEYWIVDLATKSIFVHTDPARSAYRSIVKLRRRDVLRPALLPEVAISVADVFAAR